jgi:hypothetical protein
LAFDLEADQVQAQEADIPKKKKRKRKVRESNVDQEY